MEEAYKGVQPIVMAPQMERGEAVDIREGKAVNACWRCWVSCAKGCCSVLNLYERFELRAFEEKIADDEAGFTGEHGGLHSNLIFKGLLVGGRV